MTRRGFIKGLLGAILAGLFASLYGFFIEPALRLRVQRWRVMREDWTAKPLRIVAISDLHVGEPFVGLKRVRQVVRRANALGADIIVLLGGYAAGHHFNTKPVKIADVAPELAKLSAPKGVFAVLGNHDWWDDLAAQRRGGGPNLYATALEAEGIPVLSNAARKVGDIWIAGLEDQIAVRKDGRWQGLDDLPATLAQITDDAPVVLMAHEPDIFPTVPSRVALTLSGHTHGGQVRLFGWSPIVPSRFGRRFAYGHVQETGRDLVVSGRIRSYPVVSGRIRSYPVVSGRIGCSILPVRFGVVPEITVIEVSGSST